MISTTQIAECLAATLNEDTNIRISSELKLAQYFESHDTGLSLSQLVLAQDVDMSIRQMSSPITLRKYVNERWSPFFRSFKGSAPPFNVKEQIRHAVFQGLSDKDRKIRTLSAHTLSSIASCDWPDEYPDLLLSLINLLSSGTPDSVHGAMQVFTEFIRSELTEDQILPVLRQLLPVLLNILGSTESHSPPTRARTVSVFCQCVSALFMVKDQHPQAVKEAAASVLPVWLEAFKVLLNIDPVQDVANTTNWDGLTVRIQVFKTLVTIQTLFNRALSPYLQDFLTASLAHLVALYPTFEHYYLMSLDSVPSTSEDEAVELPHLISPIIDLISSIANSGKAKEWFNEANLAILVSSIIKLAQMTNEDEDSWGTNPNAFIAQEDDETQSYSIRVAGFDLMTTLADRFTVPTTVSCHQAMQQVIQNSQQARESGMQDWWRPLEAAMAAIGSSAESIMDCVEDQQDLNKTKPIDIENLLNNIIPSLLNLTEFPFLQGRGFVFASQFSKLLNLQSAGHYLEAAVQVIESNEAGVPVKISAVKAIHNFCQDGDHSVLIPFAFRIVKDLGPFMLTTSEDTLTLVLETLSVVLEIDQGKFLTTDLAESLVLAVLQVWHRNNKDPIFLSILTDILTTLASSSPNGMYEVVVQKALPHLCDALLNAKPDETWIVGSAIELITSLIKGSPESGIGDGFFALLAPNLFKCLSQAEDRDILQNGIECLTLIIRKDCIQLLSWSDGQNGSGLDYVLSLVARTLESQDESGGLVIGDLIIHLFRRAGDSILPVLPQLLQAMIARMTTAKTATFLQSLVIPFAFLIYNQRDTVLSLLENMNVQNRSGLDILIQTWCENAETFQGFWPSRISTLALSQLYTSQRPTLQNLMVKGDIILKPESKDVIMTRSRTKSTPHEFTSIPFPLKALKIIVHDLQSDGETAIMTAQGDFNDLASDDGDEEWTEEEKVNQGFKEDEFAFLSEMIGPKGIAFDNDDILDNSDDEDLKNDPVSQMDMQGHLVAFLRECAAQNINNFSVVVDQMTTEEILVVRRAVGTH